MSQDDWAYQNADDPLSLNLYTYCANNPVSYIDPSGHEWIHWVLGGVIVVAAAAAVIITAGGALPALTAIGSVASGVAVATPGATIAAGAFIGSSTVLGISVLDAASNSRSVQDFNARGNWGTVAWTALGAAGGAWDAYNLPPRPPLGAWESANESMSQVSRDYQAQITGRTGQVYKVGGVKFDGISSSGRLMEVKADYSSLVAKDGRFQWWFSKGPAMVHQAKRQLQVAKDTPVDWYFRDTKTMNAVKTLFRESGVKGIHYFHVPPK